MHNRPLSSSNRGRSGVPILPPRATVLSLGKIAAEVRTQALQSLFNVAPRNAYLIRRAQLIKSFISLVRITHAIMLPYFRQIRMHSGRVEKNSAPMEVFAITNSLNNLAKNKAHTTRFICINI